MIELAVFTGTMPSAWFQEDPETILTALETLERKLKIETAAHSGGAPARRAPGAGGPIQYSG